MGDDILGKALDFPPSYSLTQKNSLAIQLSRAIGFQHYQALLCLKRLEVKTTCRAARLTKVTH